MIVLFDKSTDLYAVPIKPSEIGYGEKFYINDILVSDQSVAYKTGSYFMTKTLPETAYTIKNVTETVEYNNSKAEVLSKEDYESQLTLLLSKREYDEDGDGEFKTLEDELAYKYFLKEWFAKQETREIKTDLEIIIKLAPVSEYPEIQSVSTWGDIITAKESLFNYFPRTIETVVKVFKEMGVVRAGEHKLGDKFWSNSTHSEIEYLKLNDTYIVNKEENNILKRVLTNTTYEKCIERREADEKLIRNILKRGYNRIYPSNLSEKSTATVLDFIRLFEINYPKIDYKQKSYSDYNYLRNAFNKFKQQFTETI